MSNLDFENAEMKVSTPFNTYTFFWCNKEKLHERELKAMPVHFEEHNIRYYENAAFYFGLGDFNIHARLPERKSDPEMLRDFDIEFPYFIYK